MSTRRTLLASVALLALSPASALAATPQTITDPVSKPLEITGTGLCAASAISLQPATDFQQSQTGYNPSVNDFIEAHKADRVESVIRTLLDLSNNNDSGVDKPSYGDFRDQFLPICGTGGCPLYQNDDVTSFATRMRGFLNVTEELAGKPLHFGIYCDDAVSLTFFNKNKVVTPVITRPPILGFATWRTTNTVTFEQPGLYPLEVLYVEIGEDAAFEMSYRVADGTFTDFEYPLNNMNSVNLNNAGFTLFQPTAFFHTLSGEPSFPDFNQCQQCERQFADQAGNHGCVPGYYCNAAALCAPCDTDIFCGPTCSPCQGETPFCINTNEQAECGACRDDFDCKVGYQCDPVTHTCHECNEDTDCVKGDMCVDHACVPCDTQNACAGNSCNCCPTGLNGKQMQCSPVDSNGPSVCVECTQNAECQSGICDALNGHCVDELKPNASPTCCGDNCVACPAEAPFCIPGPVGTACAQCRHDMDCGVGEFCLSGSCALCVRDKRCGLRCDSCEGDTPYCLASNIPDKAECVRCTNDAQCNGGTCNKETHACEPGCAMSCAPETPHCDGTKCVECYADTQCPCGGACDLGSNTCSPSCKTNGDCLGNEHCRWKEDAVTKECGLGPMPGDVSCGGTLADACGGATIGDRGKEPPPAGLIALAMLALMGRRRVRGKS